MPAPIDQRTGGAVVRLVSVSARRYVPILLVVAVVTPLLGAYSARHLGVNAEMASLFDDDLPHRIREIDYQRAFPSAYENLVVVVDAESPEVASRVARRLTARMRREPSLFRHVLHPGSLFFERRAFLYADQDDLEVAVDRLAVAQPYLATLAADPSLVGLATILARGARAGSNSGIDSGEMRAMFDRFSEAIAAGEAGRRYQVPWAEIFFGGESANRGRRQIVIAQPVLDLSKLLAAETPIENLRRWDRRHARPGVDIRITGDMALAYEELKILERQMIWASIASFLIVATSMIFAFRSARLILAAVINMAVGLIWTMFFATTVIGHLNMISIAFAVLFIGLSDDYGVHFCMRYRELRRMGSDNFSALSAAARDAGIAITVCAGTTAIGFYAFVPTNFRGVAELGLISGTGMFVNVALCFTVLPALITLVAGRTHAFPAIPTSARAKRRALPVRRPLWVVGLATVAVAASLFAVPFAHFDANPLRVRDPSTESVQAFEDLIRTGEGSPWNVNVAVGKEAAHPLADALRALPEVNEATTIDDFVPGGQESKRAILQDAALFLGPEREGLRTSRPVTIAATLAAIEKLERATIELGRTSADPDLARSAAQLADGLGRLRQRVALGSKQGDPVLTRVERSLLGHLPSQLVQLERALRPPFTTLDDLPRALVDRMVAVDGRYRIEISPAEDLNDDDAMVRFVEAIRTIAPDATGGAATVYESKVAVVAAFRQAFGLAIVAIAGLLLWIWRKPGDTALVMIPLGLAALFTTALAVVAGIPFNYANVIVLPLLFGLGVNSGIHLVERWRLGDTPPHDLLDTSTAKAIVYSCLNTVGSFGTLAFTTHQGMASMGQLLALGVSLTVVCNLLVLPALIVLRSGAAFQVE